MRLMRNRRQVKKQLTLTHVQTAQGDINKGEQQFNDKNKTLRNVFVYLKMGNFNHMVFLFFTIRLFNFIYQLFSTPFSFSQTIQESKLNKQRKPSQYART